MTRCFALLALGAAVAIATSVREVDLPLQAGYCVGSGLASAVASCSSQKSESKCSGYTVLWTKACKWMPQPFASSTYQALSAKDKMSKLMKKITANKKSGSFPWKISVVANVVKEDLKTTFNFASDEMPQGHTKIIHSVGTHSGFEWVNSGKHPYTGLFKSGSTNGILRFSLAASPGDGGKFKAPGSQPGAWKVGISVKLLRDGMPSANFVAMRPLGAAGQNSANFFQNELVNHVAAPDNAVLQDKFATASEWVNMVGLKDFAEYDSSGKKTSSPIFPWKLTFKPTKEVSTKFPNQNDGSQWTKQLSSLSPGTTVYDIYAQAGPKTGETKIGSMKLKTAPVTSDFGDKQLFFQHRKMEFDFAQNKKWLSETSDKPVKSKFFAPIGLKADLGVMDKANTELNAANTCPFATGAGTTATQLAVSTEQHAAKDAYIASLHTRIQQLTAEKSNGGSQGSSHSWVIGIVLVGMLAGVVGALVARKFNSAEASYTAISV